MWVPTIRLAWPSKLWPKAAFSELASAWTSITTACTVPPGPHPVPRQFRLGGAEGVVQGVHEQAAHDVDHQGAAAVPELRDVGAAAGGAGREVGRADDPRLGFEEGDDLPPVPGMVAEGDHVGAGLQEGPGHVGGEAEAVGGVLAVHHHEVEPEAIAQSGQGGGQRVAAGAADDVAQEKQSQAGSSAESLDQPDGSPARA